MSAPQVDTKLSSFINELKLLPPPQQLICAFERVRDIHYGDIGSRNPFDVFRANKGTCSGKHALLKIILESLGYEVQTWFAKHDFSRLSIVGFPDELRAFQAHALTDYHDFLKVLINDDWLAIDAVFDKDLRLLGFPVADWDGSSPMEIPFEAEEIFCAEGEPEEHKRSLLSALPVKVQNDRKNFLKSLTIWFETVR